MNGKRILVAEDDPQFRFLLVKLLEDEGYEVIPAVDGEEALKQCRAEHPDLIILDIVMPGMDGIEVCRRLREENNIPILFLTAKGKVSDLVKGLDTGGDDYISKFSERAVLIARVRAALRHKDLARTSTGKEERVSVDGLEIDRRRREVHLEGELVDLTRKEFDLLWLLAGNRGRALSREEIVKSVWGCEDPGFSRAVDYFVARLRKKIERESSNPEFIKTVRGMGYRFL